jgi:cytochrome c-type biogenesis protein CcmH
VRRLLIVTAAAFGSGLLLAQQPVEELPDPEQNARYQALIQEVRCLVCLNQTIAESKTDLAGDLRREIREQVAGGASDREIVAYLTDRYGDFVMYRPPLKPSTWVLWSAPFAMLVIGVVIFARVIRSRSRQPIDDETSDAEPYPDGAGKET